MDLRGLDQLLCCYAIALLAAGAAIVLVIQLVIKYVF